MTTPSPVPDLLTPDPVAPPGAPDLPAEEALDVGAPVVPDEDVTTDGTPAVEPTD